MTFDDEFVSVVQFDDSSITRRGVEERDDDGEICSICGLYRVEISCFNASNASIQNALKHCLSQVSSLIFLQ